MLIEFYCRNQVVGADGRNSVCGKSLTAKSSQAGHLVNCPKCKSECEVPLESSEVDRKLESSDTGTPPRKKSSSKSRPGKPPRKKPGKSRTASSSDGDDLELAPIEDIARPKSDLMSMDFQESGGSSRPAPIAKDRSKRCAECGKKLDDRGYCSSCKKGERKFEKVEMELDEIPMELAGFQLWFAGIANEGVSMRVLAWVFHVLITLFTFSLVVFGLVAISGILGTVFVIFVLLFFALYVALCFKGYQFTRDPHARLAWFQKPFWNAVLMISRMMKWQAYDAKFKDRPIIDMRNKPLTDDKLTRIEGFRAAQVLDLEGTLISDEGLAPILKLKNLYCVVLRNTNVSHEGVTKLQQSIPRLWIWY
jgi:hypothetical protein